MHHRENEPLLLPYLRVLNSETNQIKCQYKEHTLVRLALSLTQAEGTFVKCAFFKQFLWHKIKFTLFRVYLTLSRIRLKTYYIICFFHELGKPHILMFYFYCTHTTLPRTWKQRKASPAYRPQCIRCAPNARVTVYLLYQGCEAPRVLRVLP